MAFVTFLLPLQTPLPTISFPCTHLSPLHNTLPQCVSVQGSLLWNLGPRGVLTGHRSQWLPWLSHCPSLPDEDWHPSESEHHMVKWYPEPTKPYMSAIHQSTKVLRSTYFMDDKCVWVASALFLYWWQAWLISHRTFTITLMLISSYLESAHWCLSWPFQIWSNSFYTWRYCGPQRHSAA